MLNKIKELRARTFLGLTICKEALQETNGNIDEAIVFLQNRDNPKDKRFGDLVLSLEGEVRAFCKDGFASIVEVNCEPDFNARSDLFKNFVSKFVEHKYFPSIYLGECIDVENETTNEMKQEISNLSKQLGEKVIVRRKDYLENFSEDSNYKYICNCYNHPNGKIAVILETEVKISCITKELIDFLDNICMHIAATNPKYIDVSDIPYNILEDKKNEFNKDVSPKQEKMRDKIVAGKLEKWYSEVCLMKQLPVFIENNEFKRNIGDLLYGINNKYKLPENVPVSLVHTIIDNASIINNFIRYERGEELK